MSEANLGHGLDLTIKLVEDDIKNCRYWAEKTQEHNWLSVAENWKRDADAMEIALLELRKQREDLTKGEVNAQETVS